MDEKELYQPPYKQELLFLYAKYVMAVFAFLVITSIAAVMVGHESRLSIIVCGLACAAYFVGCIIELYRDEKLRRLKSVMAIVVSKEDSVTMMRQVETTYRLIPVDETGEFIDKNGKYDFFLKFQNGKGKKSALYIGGIYLCLFKGNESHLFDFSERNLVLKKRQNYVEVDNGEQGIPEKSDKPTEQPDEPGKNAQDNSKTNLIYLNLKK